MENEFEVYYNYPTLTDVTNVRKSTFYTNESVSGWFIQSKHSGYFVTIIDGNVNIIPFSQIHRVVAVEPQANTGVTTRLS